MTDETHSFIENIQGIENLNELHLNQLNNQLRYELRNLNKQAGVDVHLTDDEDEDEDEVDVDVDIDDDVDDNDNDNDNDSNENLNDNEEDSDDNNDEYDDNVKNHSIETLTNAFNESESEPFKNYIKSIVERGHNSTTDHINHLQIDNNTEIINANTVNSFADDVDDVLVTTDEPILKRLKLHSENNSFKRNDLNTEKLEKMNNLLQNKNLKDFNSNNNNIKKCSRCRVKRTQESESSLQKYQTCEQCRERRKVKQKKRRVLVKLPNLADDWKTFISRVALNNVIDLFQHNYRAYSNEIEFPRYDANSLNSEIIQRIGEKVIERYIWPLQEVTGFKFAIRDHHNPPLYDNNRAKKITWMFICSQDKLRRRKSRSENKRQVLNKLKTEECCSKITMSYDIVYGIIQISYNHKHHKPFNEINGNNDKNDDSQGKTIINGDNRNEDIIIDTENIKSSEVAVDRAVMEAAAAAVAAVAASTHEENQITENIERINENNKHHHHHHHHIDENQINEDVQSRNEVFDAASHFGNIDDIGIIGNVDVSDVDVDVDVGVDINADVDVDVDINADDVAEIAKLLKQVQQAQSRRLSGLKSYEQE
jgi:hypothetical protein